MQVTGSPAFAQELLDSLCLIESHRTERDREIGRVILFTTNDIVAQYITKNEEQTQVD